MKMAGMKEKPGAEITKLVKMVKLVILTIFARTKNGINNDFTILPNTIEKCYPHCDSNCNITLKYIL